MDLEGHIFILIKDISTSQEPPASSKPPAMSSIFEIILDAFKLNRFQPNFKHSFLRAYEDHPKRHHSSKTPAPLRNVHNHHWLQQQLQQCYWSLRVILMPSNLTDFNQILNLAYSGHMQSRTPALVRNVHNHHRLQQQLQQCHRSLRVILMPSNWTDFNQILNLASSEQMQTIQNIIKDTSPSQEYP